MKQARPPARRAVARAPTEPEQLRVRVVAEYPHDPQAFTQGLLVHRGKLYESTGQRGESSVRRVDLLTGRVEQRVDLEAELFGEGLALVGDRLIQLTWTERRALVWDVSTLRRLGEYSYRGQGWGLCYDGQRLIMSDGTSSLQFRDPNTFEPAGRVAVVDHGGPVGQLNELECVDGHVYANVWTEEVILRIDPATGYVVARVDARGILRARDRRGNEDVFNGIAYWPETGRFLVTGKYWPKLYEVEFVPLADAPDEGEGETARDTAGR